MSFSGLRAIQIFGLSVILIVFVFALHFYTSSLFRKDAGVHVKPKVIYLTEYALLRMI